jgi:hypothetical protein
MPAQSNSGKLTASQLGAIIAFAKANGRNWKLHLRLCWETGIYGMEDQSDQLQQIRNQLGLGPSWLVRFSLKKALALEVRS